MISSSRAFRRLALLTLLTSLLAVAPASADIPSQFGQMASFGGFDESAYNNGNYGGTLTPGKFLDVKGFAVDTQDSEGGSQNTALYVVDRTSSNLVANTSWRIQKLDQSGNVLGTTTFNLPNGKFNATAIAGLTVDHAAGRLYALVIGQPSTAAQVPVAQELLAWSIAPNASKELEAATGLASDPLGTTGALVSERSQLQPGGGTPLYGPEGIALDPHNTGGATDPIVIEASELSNGIGKGSPIPGDTIVQQVATSPQSGKVTGDLLGSWTDASVPGAAVLDHYGPAGISINPDGTLTVLLEADTSLSAGNVNVLKLNADLSSPVVVSEPAQRPAVVDLDQAPFYTDVPPFSTLPSGISLASGAGSPLVQLSTPASSSAGGLYAAIFQPSHDNVDYQFGGEQPGPFYWHDAGSDQSPAWTANIGVRLLSPTAAGAISEPNGGTIVNTLGARSGACGIDAPYAALAAGNNGALWVIDSGEQTVNAGATGGGRRIVELQSGASSSLCPQPSGTFTVSGNGTTQLASATPSLTVPAGTKVAFDAGDASATPGGMSWQGGTPYAFEWDLNGNATDGPNGDGFETINQMQASAYTFPTPKTTYEYKTPGTYHVRLKLVNDYGSYVTSGTVVVVAAEPPSAVFEVTTANPLAGQAVGFNASGSAAGTGGAITNYHWNWGDGTSVEESGPQTTHAYASPGAYQVTLTVENSAHETSTSPAQTVNVGSQSGGGGGGGGGGGNGGGGGGGGGGVSSQINNNVPPSVSPQVSASSGGVTKVAVSCPVSETSCAGTVQIKTANAIAAGAKAKKGKHKPKASQLVLGQASFSLSGGQSQTVVVHLSAKGQALLAKQKSLRVLVVVSARSSMGAVKTETLQVTLKAAASGGRKARKHH